MYIISSVLFEIISLWEYQIFRRFCLMSLLLHCFIFIKNVKYKTDLIGKEIAKIDCVCALYKRPRLLVSKSGQNTHSTKNKYDGLSQYNKYIKYNNKFISFHIIKFFCFSFQLVIARFWMCTFLTKICKI